MVDGNFDGVHWYSDIDTLKHYGAESGISWTAPRWLTGGDILFFYHTKNSRTRAAALLSQAQAIVAKGQEKQFVIPGHENEYILELRDMEQLIQLLTRATEFAARFAGTIFGCAEAGGPGEYFRDEDDVQHFRSTIYAPLAAVHLFNHPLRLEQFSDLVKIGQSTITPLYEAEFEAIKQLLAESNSLPSFLQRTRAGGLGFRSVTAKTWFQVSCSPRIRFLNESQIRVYLLDYFLNALKDSGTSLLVECQCFRNHERTGIADYFITLHGNWVPIEAKLNILGERDIFQQSAKYTHIDSFSPTRGQHNGKNFIADDCPICIVIDQTGMFIVRDGKFIACDRSSPLFKREQLTPESIPAIRERLASILA